MLGKCTEVYQDHRSSSLCSRKRGSRAIEDLEHWQLQEGFRKALRVSSRFFCEENLMRLVSVQAAFTEFSGMKAANALPLTPKTRTFSSQVAAQKSTVIFRAISRRTSQ